jgi:hypothetical protein
MKTFRLRAVACLVLFAASLSIFAALTPDDLRCDYAVNPLGVDSATPRLFWKLKSSETGQRQTAFEILAASSEQNLEHDNGDLWSSGKVSSDETIQIPYSNPRSRFSGKSACGTPMEKFPRGASPHRGRWAC